MTERAGHRHLALGDDIDRDRARIADAQGIGGPMAARDAQQHASTR
jgi:hypothetical protein